MLERELTIFLYHYIVRPPDNVNMRGLYTSPKQFDWQLRRLKNAGVRFFTFQQLRENLRSPRALASDEKAPWLILTFDDGSVDVYTHAFPLLQKYQIPAVVYPVVGDLGKTQVLWSECSQKTPVNMLTKDQLREMARYGIEFGSHLYQHVNAPKLSDAALRYELQESKHVLEDLLNAEVLSIAYPYGNYNKHVLNYASEAGYSFGLTTRRGTNIHRNPLELCRLPIKGTRWYHPFYFRRVLNSLRGQ